MVFLHLKKGTVRGLPFPGHGVMMISLSLTELVKTIGNYSLACDENFGFGVFFVEIYGTAQTIVTNTSDVDNKFMCVLYVLLGAQHVISL